MKLTDDNHYRVSEGQFKTISWSVRLSYTCLRIFDADRWSSVYWHRLPPHQFPPFCHSLRVIFISFSFFFSPLPSPLSSTSPSPFLLYFLPTLPSSFLILSPLVFLPPFPSILSFTRFPPSFFPVSSFYFLCHSPTSLPFRRFINRPAEALSDRIQAVSSDGVTAANERAHKFPDIPGVHWHNDSISPAFILIVVGSHWKYLWRLPSFCFSHHPS